MKLTAKKLKELLVTPGYISPTDFELAEQESDQKRKPLEQLLVEKELIADEELGKIIAQYLGVQFVALSKEKIDPDLLALIPELVAKSKGVIAFSRDDRGTKVGMLDPRDLETLNLIEKRLGDSALPYLITKRDLKNALAKYKPGIRDAFQKLLKRFTDKNLSREEKDEITVQMVDTLLQYGQQNKASDVHIEPYQDKVMVRFRIDGILHEVLQLPKELEDLIVMRIKILAQLRTDEHRAAQDGRLQFKAGQEEVDVRVSIVPVTEGENVVMRLLSATTRQFGLRDLGFSENNFQKIQEAIKKPHGMILVTGPTGSGKTTTLYAVIKILNKPEVHIATIEDPVEYDIEGVRQIQVNPKTNLTFAKGLRAIVRQDPDIIMVGEIRDEETAGIAVNSALTGHLVLSTLHTNDAVTTLPRLLDMGVEPFLVASTVNIAIAQRLVRKTCEKCRASYPITKEELTLIKNDARLQEIFTEQGHQDLGKLRFFKGSGCKVCGATGYIGRTGVFEVLEMADNIKELVVKRAASGELMKIAQQNGMQTMLEDGIEKVMAGVTTLQEVLRVTRE